MVNRTIYKNVCLNSFSTFLGWLLNFPHLPRVWHIFRCSLNWSINQYTFHRTSISVSHHSRKYFYTRTGVHRTLSITSQAKSCQGLQLGLKQNTTARYCIHLSLYGYERYSTVFQYYYSPHPFRIQRLLYYVNVTSATLNLCEQIIKKPITVSTQFSHF